MSCLIHQPWTWSLTEPPAISFPFPGTPSPPCPQSDLALTPFLFYTLFYLLHSSQEANVAPAPVRVKQIHGKSQTA